MKISIDITIMGEKEGIFVGKSQKIHIKGYGFKRNKWSAHNEQCSRIA